MEKQELLQRFTTVSMKWGRIMKPSSGISMEDKIATFLQGHALFYLQENPLATVGKLATELSMSSPAVAKFTDRLFDAGWITRENDPDDRRIIRLELTQKGKEELEQTLRQHFEKMNEIVSLMPDSDLKELVRIMENSVKAWEEKNE